MGASSHQLPVGTRRPPPPAPRRAWKPWCRTWTPTPPQQKPRFPPWVSSRDSRRRKPISSAFDRHKSSTAHIIEVYGGYFWHIQIVYGIVSYVSANWWKLRVWAGLTPGLQSWGSEGFPYTPSAPPTEYSPFDLPDPDLPTGAPLLSCPHDYRAHLQDILSKCWSSGLHRDCDPC